MARNLTGGPKSNMTTQLDQAPEAGRPAAPAETRRYFNPELSALEFEARVLEEAADPRHPLLERIKFCAIVGGNLDQFFMIRLPDLRERAAGVHEHTLDGMAPNDAMSALRRRLG